MARPAAIMSRVRMAALGALGIICLLLVWEAGGQYLGSTLLAAPSEVIPAFLQSLVDGETLPQLGVSLAQMLVGYAIAFGVGVPAGILMARSRVVDAILHPWLNMLLVTSIAALVPLLIISFGYDFKFRVAVVLLASIWYIMLTMFQAARGLEQRYLDVAKSFVANRRQAFLKVMVPALLPDVVVAARIGLAHAIRAMVTAELFISYGFGRLLFQAGLDISTAPGLALLLLLMVVSLAGDAAILSLGRFLAPWSARAGVRRAAT